MVKTILERGVCVCVFQNASELTTVQYSAKNIPKSST